MYYAIDENAARIAHNMNSFMLSSKARLLKNIGNWLMRQPRLPLKRKTVLIPCSMQKSTPFWMLTPENLPTGITRALPSRAVALR